MSLLLAIQRLIGMHMNSNDEYVYVLKPLEKYSWNEDMDYGKGYCWWFSTAKGSPKAGIQIIENGVEVAKATLVINDGWVVRATMGWLLETQKGLSPERLHAVTEQIKAIAKELDRRIEEFGQENLWSSGDAHPTAFQKPTP